MKKKLQENINFLKKTFSNSNELIIKEMMIGKSKCAIAYLLGLCDTTALSKFVITPLSQFKGNVTLDNLCENVLYVSEITKEDNDKEIVSNLLKGKGMLFLDGEKECLILLKHIPIKILTYYFNKLTFDLNFHLFDHKRRFIIFRNILSRVD